MTKQENSDFSDFNKIMIIGLGLIGGSLAMALKGFKGASITGYDLNKAVMEKAVKQNVLQEACGSMLQGVEDADLIILALPPHELPAAIREIKDQLKAGALVTDVCGIKKGLYRELAPLIPSRIDYIGIHPMAGKEIGGFDQAEAGLFKNCGFIMVPMEGNEASPSAWSLITEMADYLEVGKLRKADAAEHDDIIAYTSDLMHISASALCLDIPDQADQAFTGGSFRDCTRVGNSDPDLWTELLLHNGESVIGHLDDYIKRLGDFKDALEKKDDRTLFTLLNRGRENKKELLAR